MEVPTKYNYENTHTSTVRSSFSRFMAVQKAFMRPPSPLHLYLHLLPAPLISSLLLRSDPSNLSSSSPSQLRPGSRFRLHRWITVFFCFSLHFPLISPEIIITSDKTESRLPQTCECCSSCALAVYFVSLPPLV